MGKNVKFRMSQINLKQFAILSERIPDNPLNMNTQIKFGCDINHHIIVCDFSLELLSDDSKLLICELECAFEIEANDWEQLKNKDGNKMIVQRNILEYISVQTIGTMRGVLYTKTEKTPYSIFIIPPINVSAMNIEDMEIDINVGD